MFKSRKLDLYELNIDGVIYWKKTIHPETKEVIFVKHKSDSYTLFLDKLGNPKDMPQINGSYYLDMVSGRLLNISENDNYVIINPSNIYIPKNKFIKDKGTLEKVCEVLSQDEESYISISEDVIFNSYFCDIISQRDDVIEITLKQVRDEILETRKGYLERQLYMEKFQEPEFSSYDFMSLFCVLNASQRNYSFNRDNLINFIKLCKDNNEFDRLLNSIRLKSNGIFPYSDELDEAIAKLKWEKILYTISPEQDYSIFIFEDIPMSELLKKRISYFDEMVRFLSKYIDYEIEMIKNSHQQLYNQETIDIDNAVKTLNDISTKRLRKEK